MQSSPNLQGYALPTNIDPSETICMTIRIPNDQAYLAAVVGALYDTTLWVSWQRDPLHIGARAARKMKTVWQDAVNSMGRCGAPLVEHTSEVDDCMTTFRQEGCLLQAQCVDGTWVTIYDPTTCVQAILTQTPPTAPPAPGACETYHVVLQGNGKYLLPVPVNAGDLISIENTNGGWSDGSLDWWCPNGAAFVLGTCDGVGSTRSGDPLPTSAHMRLIMNIDGTFYDAFNSLMPVPTGVSDAQMFFQANDDTLSDNAGSVSFDVSICAQAGPATWTHTFDFAANGQQGWTLNIPSGAGPDGPTGVFSADGFHSLPWHSAAFGQYYNYISVQRDYLHDGVITDVAVYYSNSTDGSSASVNAVDSDGADFYVWAYQVGGPFVMTHSGSISATAGQQALVDLAGSSQASGPVGGEVVFTKVVFSGTGVDPFE